MLAYIITICRPMKTNTIRKLEIYRYYDGDCSIIRRGLWFEMGVDDTVQNMFKISSPISTVLYSAGNVRTAVHHFDT